MTDRRGPLVQRVAKRIWDDDTRRIARTNPRAASARPPWSAVHGEWRERIENAAISAVEELRDYWWEER